MFKPVLSPKNIEFSAAMAQSMECAVISQRRKFFASIKNRESLQGAWQRYTKYVYLLMGYYYL